MNPTNVGVIGCGQWGTNHMRVFDELPQCKVVMCADTSQARLDHLAGRYEHVKFCRDYHELLSEKIVDAVVVSTPSATHYALAKESLRAGKHVLCEKPLCLSVEEARELVQTAAECNRTLMVGHVFVYNSSIRRLKEYIATGSFGRMLYGVACRTNLGPIRDDVDVVWDLATHDVSIFLYLFDKLPEEVSAVGTAFLQKNVNDVARISLTFPGGVLAGIHASWLDPRKVRELVLVGDRKMAVWNDLEVTGPIRLYDKGVERPLCYDSFGEFHLILREGDIVIPKLALREPLKLQNSHFLNCISDGKKPETGAENGLQVVRVLAAIQRSIRASGAPVKV